MGQGKAGHRGEGTVGQSLRELVRAVGGGLIIGLPLLFTMEMWSHGFLLPSWKILVLLAMSFVIVVGYSALSGFRRERSWLQLLVDSTQTIGLAAVVSVVALVVLGRIGPDTGMRDAIGKVALEMIPVAFGISLAGTQLAAPEDSESERGSVAGDRARLGTTGRLFLAAGGAVLFALNVAPTEEPVLLGIEAPAWLLLAAMAGSYLVTLAIVFYADFRGGVRGRAHHGPLDNPLAETAAAYAISLAVAWVLLWSFGRTDGVSAAAVVGQVVMLAVVASFGAAAGRLLVGGAAEG